MKAIRSGGKTFAELEEIMGLSNAAIFKIVSAMTESGMVIRTQLPSSTAGRKAEIITPNPAYGYFAVILAHSDVLTVTVNDFVGGEYYKKEYETGYVVKREVIETAMADVKKCKKKIHHVVFVFAGKYDCKIDKFVYAGKFAEFYGEKFAEYVKNKIGAPVLMVNDMSAAISSELLKPATPDSFMYLYIDEGVGGGIALDRKIFSGERGMAGEFGFFGMNPIDATDFFPNDKSKIFSTVLSLKSITEKYCEVIGKEYSFYPTEKEEFIAKCLKGDKTAVDVLGSSVAILGRFLWSLTELLDISHILFGGEIVRLDKLVGENLNEMFSKSPTSSQIDVKFVTESNEIYSGAIAEGLNAFEKFAE